MELLTPYIDNIENIDGAISWQLELSGLYKDPIKTGQIIFNNVNVDILQLDNSISEINGIGKINNNYLWFDNVSASLNKSDYRVTTTDKMFDISSIFSRKNH